MERTQIRALIISVVISAILYALWVGMSETDAIIASIAQIGWQGMTLILCLSLINYGIRFIRYHWLMQTLGDTVPALKNLSYYLAGFSLTTTPGKAGESIRAIYLKEHKVPYEHSIAVLLSERLLDMLAVWFIALLGLWIFPSYRWLILVTAVILILVILGMQHPSIIKLLYHWQQNTRFTAWAKILTFGLSTLDKTRALLKPSPFLISLTLAIIAWGAEAIGFAYLLYLLGYADQIVIFMSIYALAMLVGALSFLPGGLGGAELTMSLLLIAVGVSQADSVSATLLCRIATLWFAVAIGVIFILYLETRTTKPALNTK